MNPKKKKEDKKVKFTISIDPKIYKRIQEDLTNKSALIEKLLKEYYGKKDL
jgi:hypothetical protein